MASLAPRLQFRVKKEGWGGGGTRNVTFIRGQGDVAALKAGGKTLMVSIGDGLPRNASECQGTGGWQGGTQERWGHRAQLEHWGELGVLCGVYVSPGKDPFLLGDGAAPGPLGNRVQTGGQPLQLALSTVT